MPFSSLLGESLLMLQQEHATPCISVIVDQERLSPDRSTNKTRVEHVIEDAAHYAAGVFPEKEAQTLIEKMYSLLKKIDFLHSDSGIGLYVSKNISHLEKFPFHVDTKVIVENSFETRELLYKINYSQPYYVLSLTEQGARFFEARLDELQEIKNGGLPDRFIDLYQYNKPSQSTSYAGKAHVKSFEKDKQVLKKFRMADHLRRLDRHLEKYRVGYSPMVAAGTQRIVAQFKKTTKHPEQIVGVVNGNYTHLNKNSLGKIAWPLAKEGFDKKWNEYVLKMEEKIGEGYATDGISDCWKTVEEGNGAVLLVEKDYRQPGFICEDPYRLYLKAPKRNHDILPDAVDELIERTIKKNGRVYFFNNDALKNHKRVALIKRYR